MKFIKTRPTGMDKDIVIYEFAFGLEELKLLLAIVQQTRKHLPDIIDTIPTRGRLNNIKREFEKVLQDKV